MLTRARPTLARLSPSSPALSQGATLLLMLLGILDASDDGSPAAARRKRLLWPRRAVLISPTKVWTEWFAAETALAARALAAVDAAIAHVEHVE
eukprot:5931161-Prymnesium_polylepis.1